MSKAPRYRLVGYDIGTAPDENGGWVHWTDHEAIVARLTAERDDATRAKDCFQRMTRAHWEALCAMRNSINEYIPMPNTDSGPLFSPEDGPIYADIAERVIADLAESRAYALALEQELRDRAEKAEAERDAALAGAVKSRSTFPILNGNGARIDLQLVIDHGGRAKDNHGQTVNRLAERGGLSWCELYAVLHNKRWEKIDTNEAMIACRALEARYLAAIQPDPEASQAALAKAFCMGRDAAADRYSAGGGLQGDYPMWDFFGDAEKAILALPPPADLAAKIGGE